MILTDSGSEILILPKILTKGVNHNFHTKSKITQSLGNSTILNKECGCAPRYWKYAFKEKHLLGYQGFRELWYHWIGYTKS